MSMLDKCKTCLGTKCDRPCIFTTQSYITDQQPGRDREAARRRELKGQIK